MLMRRNYCEVTLYVMVCTYMGYRELVIVQLPTVSVLWSLITFLWHAGVRYGNVFWYSCLYMCMSNYSTNLYALGNCVSGASFVTEEEDTELLSLRVM